MGVYPSEIKLVRFLLNIFCSLVEKLTFWRGDDVTEWVMDEPSIPILATNNKINNIYAVVVTYNRKNLLLECLNGLLSQTVPLNGLVLVDNATNDGTAEELHRRGLINEIPPVENEKIFESRTISKRTRNVPIIYLRLPENEGGAGGFHEGIKRAHQEGPEWLWLMDDDVEPENNCLEGLLAFKDISKCIHPHKYFENGLAHQWEGYISHVTGRRIFQSDISFQKGFSFCTTNTGCFEGMLVHRDIVDAVGFPDKRFFLGSDDSTFGFLAHFHTPVLYTRDPRINKKKIYIKEKNPITDRSIYYGMRNRFLVLSYMNAKIPQYKVVRSFFIFVRFLEYSLNILQNRPDKMNGYKILFKALKDGLTGKFGKGI